MKKFTYVNAVSEIRYLYLGAEYVYNALAYASTRNSKIKRGFAEKPV